MAEILDRKAFLKAFPSEQYGRHQGLYGFVPNKLVKREIVNRFDLCFDTAMTLMEDYNFFLDCYSHCDSFFCFPETGYRYTILGSSRKSESRKVVSYPQLIGVHIKCQELLINEDALSIENEVLLSKAISDLSLAMFLETRAISYSSVKSQIDFLWETRSCIPAIKTTGTRWKLLKKLILGRNVWGAFVFVALWRSYLFIRTKTWTIH